MAELSVDLDVDTSGAVSNVNKLGDSFNDAAKELLSIVDAGKRAGKSNEDIARDISRAYDVNMKDARKSVDLLDKALRDVGDADYTDAPKKVAKGVKDGFSEAKEEAAQSGREAAASFANGLEDVADFAQETLANALSGFGPVGAAAGIALAAGLGAALSAAQQAQEKLTEARERASELASELYQNQGTIPLADRIQEMFDVLAEESGSGNFLLGLIDNWADFGSTLDSVKRSAELTGTGVDDLLRALSGSDLDQSERMLDAINEKILELESNVGTAWAWDENLRGLRETRDEIEKTVQANELAREIADSTGATQIARQEEIAGKWRDAAVDAGNYFKTLEDGTQAFDASSYLAEAEAQIAAADELKRRLVTLPPEIRAEAEAIFGSQGAVAANAYTAAYESASAEDKGRFISAAAANGQASGSAQVQALTNAFGNPVLEATVRVKRDTREWDNWRPNPKTGVIMATVPRGINQLG